MGEKIVKFIFRLCVGGLVWLCLGFVVVLGSFPYGGGNSALVHVWTLSTFAILVWAIAAFFSKSSAESHADQREKERNASPFKSSNEFSSLDQECDEQKFAVTAEVGKCVTALKEHGYIIKTIGENRWMYSKPESSITYYANNFDELLKEKCRLH